MFEKDDIIERYGSSRKYSAPIGALAKVIYQDKNEPIVEVRWLDRIHDQNDGGYLASDFKLFKRLGIDLDPIVPRFSAISEELTED